MLLFPGRAVAADAPVAAESVAAESVAVESVAIDAAVLSGAVLFEQHCSGCHLKGGNIIRRGKTLKLKALQRNQVDNLEAVVALVTQGKGNMSAYGEPTAPGEASRLSPEEIETVSRYVLDQAQTGWH